MARFVTLDPSQVHVGRGMQRERDLVPYREALRQMEAGRIDLNKGERPNRVHTLLRAAASAAGLRVHVAKVNEGKTIYFKTYPNVASVSRLD